MASACGRSRWTSSLDLGESVSWGSLLMGPGVELSRPWQGGMLPSHRLGAAWAPSHVALPWPPRFGGSFRGMTFLVVSLVSAPRFSFPAAFHRATDRVPRSGMPPFSKVRLFSPPRFSGSLGGHPNGLCPAPGAGFQALRELRFSRTRSVFCLQRPRREKQPRLELRLPAQLWGGNWFVRLCREKLLTPVVFLPPSTLPRLAAGRGGFSADGVCVCGAKASSLPVGWVWGGGEQPEPGGPPCRGVRRTPKASLLLPFQTVSAEPRMAGARVLWVGRRATLGGLCAWKG